MSIDLKKLADLIEHRSLDGLNGIAFDLGTREIDIQAEIVKALRACVRPEERQNPLLSHDCRDNMTCRICGSLSIAAFPSPRGKQ